MLLGLLLPWIYPLSMLVARPTVTVEVDSRIVTVKGPRCTLVKNFRHAPLEFAVVDGGDKLRVDIWFATKKQLSAVNTISSHIKNMIIGTYQVGAPSRVPSRDAR